ncbi:MAG: FTR1 family protein [Actinomycetota bacterium]|nr:FTR1 family protein [Actinomycetota bacterium]
MLATFAIFIREGIEASMIVAILLAYLNQIERRDLFKDVLIGVAAALAFAGIVGSIIYTTLKVYAGSRLQTQFETVTYLLAAAVMTYMTFWMTSHGKSISKDLKNQANEAMSRGARFGIAFTAAQAVGRESLEAMVFTLAILFATSAHLALVGAVAGLIVSLAIAVMIYRLGKKINIAKAFRYLGFALMIFAAGLLVDAIANLQQLGYLPLLTKVMWNSTALLNDQSTFGDIVHSFFGYSSTPTLLQGLTYVGYLGVVLSIFAKLTKGRKKAKSEVAGAAA